MGPATDCFLDKDKALTLSLCLFQTEAALHSEPLNMNRCLQKKTKKTGELNNI